MGQIYKGCWYNSCCVLHINQSGLILSNIRGCHSSPVHVSIGQDKIEEYLQSYNESMKTKQKTREQ